MIASSLSFYNSLNYQSVGVKANTKTFSTMGKTTNNNDSSFVKALNYEIPENMIETIKDKNNPNARPLKYLSWSYAWSAFKQLFPDATFKVIHNPVTHLPYFSDPEAGIMVETEINANGETQMMWLFVMNGANKAMKLHPYTYQVWNSYNKAYEEKTVQAATMFDISKTLLRCLVKNMAIFGFGLDLYSKQDLPEVHSDDAPKSAQPSQQQYNRSAQAQPQPQMHAQVVAPDQTEALKTQINATTNVQDLISIYMDNTQTLENNPELKSLMTNRKKALQTLAA